MRQPVGERIGYLVKQLQHQVRQASDAALREQGLTMAQYAVLAALAESPGIAAAELARRTFVTRQSLQDVLRGLRAAGLVAVATSGAGRSRGVTLTPRAAALLAGADAAVREVEARMLAGIDAADVATTAAVLRRCGENLTG